MSTWLFLIIKSGFWAHPHSFAVGSGAFGLRYFGSPSAFGLGQPRTGGASAATLPPPCARVGGLRPPSAPLGAKLDAKNLEGL